MYAGAFPDGKLEIKSIFAQGNSAVAEFVARGTHGGELMGIAPTGKSIEINVCNVVELRDGKVYREREYMDLLTLLSQLGVTEIPGASAPVK